MVKRSIYPPAAAWVIFSLGLSIFLSCSGISLLRAENYRLQLAQHNLAVNTVLSDVKKVSDTLEQSAKTSAIAPEDRRKIEQLTQKSDRILEAVEQNIEEETEKLIKSESEE